MLKYLRTLERLAPITNSAHNSKKPEISVLNYIKKIQLEKSFEIMYSNLTHIDHYIKLICSDHANLSAYVLIV